MYLRVGSKTRPFNEARVAISYAPRYDARRRMVAIREIWTISGRVTLQTNATQTRMTQALQVLEADFNQFRPDLVFLEDDGITESFFKVRASECIDGPYIIDSGFPADQADVYATGTAYSVVMEFVRPVAGSGSNPILEFQETVSNPQGGQVDGFIGGAINFAERQTFQQNAPYLYTQSGRAVGLYGYPQIPPPLWPGALLKKVSPVLIGARVLGQVNTEYEVQWSYEFGSTYALSGYPHSFT